MIFPEYTKDGRFMLALIFTLFFILYVLFLSSPASFPSKHIVTIEEGVTVDDAASILKEEKIIKSKVLFKSFIVIFGGDVLSGDYFFPNRDNIFTVSYRIGNGKFGVDPISVTVPEGFNNREISELLATYSTEFNKELFLRGTDDYEGYLFPDTYYFLPNQTITEIISKMRRTFDEKTKELKIGAEENGLNWEDVIIMASLLEEEARTIETKKKIAGILWKRIEIGMPLQVDAVFTYILGINGLDITLDDLEVDSPYNTYKHTGLPIAPITNPGLDSIEAAIYYEETPYLYYLSDPEGTMHYAEDFEGHKDNRFKYLR